MEPPSRRPTPAPNRGFAQIACSLRSGSRRWNSKRTRPTRCESPLPARRQRDSLRGKSRRLRAIDVVAPACSFLDLRGRANVKLLGSFQRQTSPSDKPCLMGQNMRIAFSRTGCTNAVLRELQGGTVVCPPIGRNGRSFGQFPVVDAAPIVVAYSANSTCKRRPRAESTFSTVPKLGFPSSESAL